MTQGKRINDYHWCFEGELVRVGGVCAADRHNPDGGCGCGRAFTGLDSHRATTTARVVDMPLTLEEYAEALQHTSMREGWREVDCEEEAAGLAHLVAEWPVDTIIERRLDEVRVRAWPPDAGGRG